MKKLLEYPKTFFTAVVALQTVLLINSRALWFSDEIRYANAYSNLVHHGKWVVLFLNGEPYPDKPPVYFWFVWLIQQITRLDIPTVMYVATAITGLFYILAHYYFAITVTNDRKLSFVSGLVLLSNFFFVGLLNYIRMDLLFAALIVLSFTFMYKYLTTDSRLSVYIAFLLASVAVLTKGPIGIVMPLMFFLIGVIVFKAWRKLFSVHFLLGLIITLLPIAGWLLAIIGIEGYEYLRSLIMTQVVKRAVHTWHHEEAVYYYVYALFLAWLPWVLIVFTSGFGTVRRVSADFYRGSKGGKYAVIAIISGFVFLSALSGKIAIYALPIFSPMALYVAFIFLNNRGNKIFWRAVSVFFVVMAFTMFFINHIPGVPDHAHGNILCGAVALICASVVWFMGRADDVKAAVVFVLCVTVFFNFVGLTVIPSLDNILSPKRQGTLMKNYIEEGYKPVAYKVYSALYTYYAGQTVYETKHLDEVSKLMNSDKRIVLGIAVKYWKRWKDRPEDYEIVDSQWISGREYYLVINKPVP